MPLRTIELRTLETPRIDLEGISFNERVTQAQVDAALNHPFWVKVSGQLFPFDFDGLEGGMDKVPLEHARWFADLLGQLSPAQVRQAFEASGATPEEVDGFSQVVLTRIATLRDALQRPVPASTRSPLP